MKVAISTDSGKVSGHFGRCPEFTLAEVEDGEITEKEVIENPGHKPGFIPKFLNDKEVDMIIAGGIGRKAISMFDDFDVDVVSGCGGESVDDVLERTVNGELEEGANPCSPGEGKGYGKSREDK